MLRSLLTLSLTSLSVLLMSGVVLAADPFTGRVTEITTNAEKMTVNSTSEGESKAFSLRARSLKVMVNGRAGKVTDLKVGDLVTVFASSRGEASRIYKRSVATSDPDREPSSSETESSATTAETSGAVQESEWKQFLGPDRENRSPATGLLSEWPESGPKLLWTARNLGEGYSAVSVVNGKVFTMGTRDDQEAILAFDLQTGQELWAVKNGEVFQNNQGNGPRSTPTYDNGKLYTLGASGDLTSLTEDGKQLWTSNILKRFSADNITWGISESPLVDGEKLICTPGGNGATMVALRKDSGQVVWRSEVPGNPKAGYASPILSTIRGKEQYINFCHSGVLGVDAETGRALWGDDNAANDTANCSSPLDLGNDRIFYASGYGTGGALLDLSGTAPKPKLVYKTEKMKNHHGGMVEVDGHIYGANGNILTCLDAKSGAITWQDRLFGNGKGAITYAEGHLYFRSEKGPMYLVEANPKEFRLKGEFEQPERSQMNAWARPVVADGKLFLRDQDILLCYDVSK